MQGDYQANVLPASGSPAAPSPAATRPPPNGAGAAGSSQPPGPAGIFDTADGEADAPPPSSGKSKYNICFSTITFLNSLIIGDKF